ncbi:MAG TPA: ribbon-helix-helix protein, CopG family [Dehalococcoidia bacterium]|nr:ribbon-helix-helix protein, CopG family [Dehalococcoidia bacterium]
MPKKIIQVPVDRELLKALDEVSRSQGRSRSALIREACAKYIANADKEELIRQHIEGYRRMPETQEELDFAESSAKALAELLADDAWNGE